MQKELEAKVVAIYPVVSRKTKTGEDFESQKVLIEWDSQEEYPSRAVLEQGGIKKMDVVRNLEEGKTYKFSLNFRANTRTDQNGVDTAFGSISAWRAEEVKAEGGEGGNSLPF